MARSKTLMLFLSLVCAANVNLQAQGQDVSSGVATPKDMIEVGLNGGVLFVSGDVNPEIGYAGGLHIRKALDYVFAFQIDLLGGKAMGDNGSNRQFDMTWLSSTAYGIVSLNNFRFDRVNRKLNYYAKIGAGINNFMTEYRNENTDPRKPDPDVVERAFAPHAALGIGFAVRVSPRFNVGLDYSAMVPFGRRADLMDGSEKDAGVRSPFRDVLQYPSVRFNFNLGNPSNKSEPLYWVNPLDRVIADLEDVKERTNSAIVDSDGDGVIDAIDQEPNTPSDIPVDTKGRTLDSDRDGVPDFRDREPYYPPRGNERVNDDGVVVNPVAPAGGVTEARVQEMIDEALSRFGVTEGGGNATVSDLFLPMLHFPLDSYTIKYSDYGTLASIARMMKGNGNMRLVVTGYTDNVGAENYNAKLSYNRANAVIDHLVTQHGIARGRLILEWKGQNDALVPLNSSYMNRRVEFRVAGANDVEMDPPSDGASGTKDGGY